MMRSIARINLVVFLSGAVFAQSTGGPSITAGAPPTFEIADVHVSPHTMAPNQSGGFLHGDRYELRQATMVDLVRLAYGVDADKVQGGPSWLETDRFDVIAKAPASTSRDTVKLMLQALLADRFKLVVHNDTKPMPGFVLSLGKGKPKLKEANDSGQPGCSPPPRPPGPPPPPVPGVIPYNELQCRNVTMEVFAQVMPRFANAYLTGPMVDQTGLKGSWDFDVKWTSKGALAAAGPDGISIFDAIDKQLGLKAEAGKVPMGVIVVDSVNQTPTGNSPDVTTALPPLPPAEFEVADIKLTPPDYPQGMMRLQPQPGGRINIEGTPLKFLMEQSWYLTDEMIVGAPKWMETERYNVLAKASTLTDGTAGNLQLDYDSLLLMLRPLLIDRFKLKIHMEERPVSGYVLSAPGKPKLTKADPSNRTGCKEGPGADGKDPRVANPVLSRLMTCQNMTMAQFVDLLPGWVNGYVHTPVLDTTGLTDAYDFTLSFSAIGILQNNIVPGQAPGTANSDPNGAVSFPDAVSRQMGLKIELQKRPMQVLVIDHAERPDN
jgi:uncharacterized protein (TIGR03435 family)